MKLLLEKYRALVGINSAKMIFIIGTGRSGTHWLGYILKAHPDVRVTIEKSPMFDWVTRMALYPDSRVNLLPMLIRRYKIEYIRSVPRHYADKSHPNIWIADKLAEALPNALFVGIQRNPYATVASMLRHDGVLLWQKRWGEFPIPNQFLGITIENAEGYNDLPMSVKCALRWHAHKEQMVHLKNLLGSRLKIFHYEALIKNTEHELYDLRDFLQLTSPIPFPLIRSESLDKWKYELIPEVQNQIAEVVGIDFTTRQKI